MESLHEYEVAVLPHLKESDSVAELIAKSKLDHIRVMRALQWLSNKELVSLNYRNQNVVILAKNGKKALEYGLPEVVIWDVLQHYDVHVDSPNKDLEAKKVSSQDIKANMGYFKRANAISLEKTDQGLVLKRLHDAAAEKTIDDDLIMRKEVLAKIGQASNQVPLETDTLTKQEKSILDELKRRPQMIEVKQQKVVEFTLTKQGEKVASSDLSKHAAASNLSASMLKDGSWKDATFRPFRVADPVPPIHGAKRHVVSSAKEYIRDIWVEMGFEEMKGNYVETAFWDLDVLFVPQDHPARAMQDTFYLNNPTKDTLPKLAKAIAKIHEDGGDTGSTGWKYTFSNKESSRLMLRTHCTAVSAHTLANLDIGDVPKKFFSVDKVFRNEAMDQTHLFEFHQIDGIVVGKDVTLVNLLGYLKEFFGKLGFPDVQIRPGYFPYTEPSAEVDVWHPGLKKWVELGGAGMFRPEVVEPLLGKGVQVLAWGLGLERGIMDYLKLDDVRDLYRGDLVKLQQNKYWMK